MRRLTRYAGTAAVILGLLFWVLNLSAQAQATVTVPSITVGKGKVGAVKISIAGAPSAGLRDFQGRLAYDPHVTTVQAISGLNNYNIAAFRIDNTAGEVVFIGFKVSGQLITQGEFLEIDMLASGNLGDKSSLVLTFDTLNSPNGSIPYVVQNGQLLVTTPEQLQADFSFEPSQPEADQEVKFTDKSTGGGTLSSWSWDFGDSTATSTVQNPTHTYTASGTFTVTLTVRDERGSSNTASKTITVLHQGQLPPVLVHVFPNPARLSATFSYSLPQNTDSATLYVFSMTGRQVMVKELNVSASTFQWDLKDSAGSNAPNGPYYYVIRAVVKDRGVAVSSVSKMVIQRSS